MGAEDLGSNPNHRANNKNKINMEEVYKDCKLYGPYNSGKDGRLRCVIVHPNGRKQTLSYPKYLIEKHLNRYLTEDETVDHIDENFLNNDISNLRVINRKEHATNDVLRNEDVIVKCSYCGKEFKIEGSKLHGRNRKDKGNSGYFCSRTCSGKYGAELQHGQIEKITKEKVKANKFKLHSK